MHGSTIYVEGSSALHKLHPLTKLAFTVLCLAIAAASPNILWLFATFGFLLIPIASWGRLLRAFLKSCATVVIPFTISLVLLQGFFASGDDVLFEIGRFEFTQQGALAGLTMAGRILVAFGGALLLMLSTRPDHLMIGLTQRGVPQNLAFIILTVLQIFPRFQERAATILNAQQARGLEVQTNLIGRLRMLVPLVSPLVLSSIVDVEERAMALEARAFSRVGTKTSLLILHDSRSQKVLRWTMLLAMFSLLAWRVSTLFA